MSTPFIKPQTQPPEATVATEAPTSAEQVSVTASSKPATVPTTLPPVTDPIADAATQAAASSDASLTVSSGGVVAPKSTTPGLTAPPAPGTASALLSAKSKSKKKKGLPTVTMATAPAASSGAPGTQGENTGRWTAEEHRLFLQGLEQHGKGWKKIASLIKSRTVVQIRTHAQKYFQKLAKARQNGEEGDVAMEGRGGTTSVAAGGMGVSNSAHIKRRRQTTGTKRKAISSVVASAQRQGKKMAAAQAAAGVSNPAPPLPAVAPALAPFVMPEPKTSSSIPSITTAQGVVSGAALEDSLFRFLTPTPVSNDPFSVQVNDVARQAGANAITVPTDIPSNSQATGGEISPTGVTDMAILSSWTDSKDLPTWYSKGADVDCLLDVAEGLDWLTDTGDLNEVYNAPPPDNKTVDAPQLPPSNALEKETSVLAQAPSSTSFGTQDSEVPPLPSLFEGSEKKHGASTSQLTEASEGIDEHLDVFDTPMEEHAFVSALLGNTGESSGSLPALG